MKYGKRWEEIEEIGEGGQGKVFRVLDKHEVPLDDLADTLFEAVQQARQKYNAPTAMKLMREVITEIVKAENPVNHGALKILHSPDKARNFDDAEERLKRELEAMHQADHPNLLEVVDLNIEEKWFVSKYYPNGTLKNKSDWYKGQVKRTLTAIRPLIDGVATLHEDGIIHRDIKPENIFVDENEQLVLGDFGLVFFTDSDHTRLSGTLEKVGSSDWMPPWALRSKIEDINPSFDVFSLGKVIWAMVSGKPFLDFWYHRELGNNVEEMFRGNEMKLLNGLLDKCIVERKRDCLKNAGDLLSEIDDLLTVLELGGDPMSEDVLRSCKVCGAGIYHNLRI
ncbi:MAG: protein kinase, partial [Gemmatimonadetes bacterium]|nr:protein kinase [Gemmatimonadota bacterium]